PVFTGETIDTTRSYGQAFFEEESFERWTKTFSTDTASVFFVTMGFLDLLIQSANERRREGDGSETASVINISAAGASTHLGLFLYSYCVSKAGLNHLTSVLATEFALKGIPVRVNAIVPGLFESEITSGTPGGVETLAKSAIPGALNPIPLRRPGR
ncbi:hypothetical protein MPER_01864, partial [Moniliophthora perniciosa FA553]